MASRPRLGGKLPDPLAAPQWRWLLHLPNFVRLYARLLRDRRVSWVPKAALGGAVLYIVLPFDLIPDVVPFLGRVDDLVLFLGACRLFIRMCPPEVVEEHVRRIDRRG